MPSQRGYRADRKVSTTDVVPALQGRGDRSVHSVKAAQQMPVPARRGVGPDERFGTRVQLSSGLIIDTYV